MLGYGFACLYFVREFRMKNSKTPAISALDLPVDLLPEYCVYTDEGCRLAKSCLACPFPVCIEDRPQERKTSVAALRGKEIFRLYTQEKTTVPELAARFNVTRPTVYAALKRRYSSMA
jgi:hypothetical protein